MTSRVRSKEDIKIEQLEFRINDLERLLRNQATGTGNKNKTRGYAKFGLVAGCLLLLYVYMIRRFTVLSGAQTTQQTTQTTQTTNGAENTTVAGALSKFDDSSLVRIPTTRIDGKFVVRPIEERLRLLEAKMNGRNNWISDPRLSVNIKHECKKKRLIGEHYLCFDNFEEDPVKREAKGQKCVVYDMGIRRQPDFGREMVHKYGCEVHAFDPSPVSTKDTSWIENNKLNVPNYHFHPYGAGGADGGLKLFEYNWEQVSPINFPKYVTYPCSNVTLSSSNKFEPKCTRTSLENRQFDLPVKTLPTIMKELGHEEVTFIKLDVEGSEYAFLEDAIDRFGCLPVQQISIEWHHFTFDNRYGGGSSPEMNGILAPLHMCGMVMYQRDYDDGGFPDDAKFFMEAGISLRYTTTSHIQLL